MVALENIYALFSIGIGVGIILSVIFYFVGIVFGIFNVVSSADSHNDY